MTHTLDAILATLASPKLPEIELSLERLQRLLNAIGNPEKKLPPTIHVAGTNGKGSTIAFLRAMYEHAGYTVHAYTSPHLVRFHERILLAGTAVKDAPLLAALRTVHAQAERHPVTYFEATTAAAFLCFAAHPADILLLETGLGGEFDATNLVPQKHAAVITAIAHDHQDFLGNTLASIAKAKAGIIRHTPHCISLMQNDEAMPVIEHTCAESGTRLHIAQALSSSSKLGLEGAHQTLNAGLAVKVVQVLSSHFPVSDTNITNGLQHAHWPGRLQKLTSGPLVTQHPTVTFYVDGGHNPHAGAALGHWLASQNTPCHLWLAMRKTKDATGFLTPLLPHVQQIATFPTPGCHDGLSPDSLRTFCEQLGAKHCTTHTQLNKAAKQLKCGEKATVLITGSLYFIGDVLKTHA